MLSMDRGLVLRIIINDGDIRKLTLPDKPSSVETFTIEVKEKLQLTCDFTLQYEDPDFNNALCNLSDMSDLPNKATLKVIPHVTLVNFEINEQITCSANETPSRAESTHSTSDTEILSSASSNSSSKHQWPKSFEIPDFSVDINYRLRQGDLLHMRDGIYLTVSRDMKHEILQKLAECMYSYKAYPTDEDFAEVATALINKHPCLREQGSLTGCGGWKNSLKFKMGNYRSKLRKAGCLDVSVNGGRRGKYSPEGQPPKQNIKKPRRDERNYLPDFPLGKDKISLEKDRELLVEEMRKRLPNKTMVAQKMDQTFPLRRKEIVETEPPIRTMMERWPALFTEREVFAEFTRIACKNLQSEFFDELDRHTPRLMKIFRSKTGTLGQTLSKLLEQVESRRNANQTSNQETEVTIRRTVVLRGLPVLLGDNPSEFFKVCFDSEENNIEQIPVGILLVDNEDSPHCSSLIRVRPVSTAIIIEGGIVMDDVRDLPLAVCLLFGLSYALHLDYPKNMKNTFNFIQQVMLDLGSKSLKPKLQTLKNQLFA
ncbi:uncharacterized protein LOC125726959 [Brienomyrus brachyistius]|uniref:uncharacterized protein LOC125726959 n=2 Tax=Brienomyrus brachyistius TaxID=42636 RepID=UPI0020B2A457|nr:uncharacterized protein LOC125726959 [Brienomyrus brachyistius]